MTEKIEATLRRLAADTSKASSPTTLNIDGNPEPDRRTDLPGDPNCPHCHGKGVLREDVPVGHPNFGRLVLCTCRQREEASRQRDALYRLSQLEELEHLTFDSFKPRGRIGLGSEQQSSLERAFNQASNFAGTQNGWLMLQGGYGCGKTHLAAAVANFAVSMGVPTLFVTVPDLLDMLRFSYGAEDTSFEERFEEIRRVPLLVLDDFGTQNATEWAQEKLFQILNFRYINRLPLVVTTNLAIEQIEGRIRSRLSDPELVTKVIMFAPDYRHPTDDTGHHELSSLALHANQTFGTWRERKDESMSAVDLKSLERAFRAAKEFSEKPTGWLVFTGTYGSGKTHLAAAIAKYRSDLGYPTLFVVVPDLLDHLRATFNPASTVTYDRRFEEIRSAPLLVLDDLGTQNMTPWVREKLYQLFNHRYNAQLPTVITTSDPIEDIDPRLRSRMLDSRLCTIHAITAPGFRGESRAKRAARK